MASIQKKEGKTGTSYFIRVSCGFDGNGKRIFRTTTYRPTATTARAIKKEVQEFADKFEERVTKGDFYEGDKTTFEGFIPVWFENWAVDHLTESSQEDYSDILKRRVVPYIGNMKLAKISPVQIENIMQQMKKDGKAIKTIRRTFTATNSVFKYAYRKSIITENPCDRVELPSLKTEDMTKGIDRDEIQCFNLQQGRAFLHALTLKYPVQYRGRTRKDSQGNEYHVAGYTHEEGIPTQWVAFFTLALYSGMRRGEMLALTWNEIDFEEQTVAICKAVAKTQKDGQVVKSPKTQAGYRTIKLPGEVFDILKKLRKEQQVEIMKQGTNWKGTTGRDMDDNFLFTQSDGSMMNVSSPRVKFGKILANYNAMVDRRIEEGTATEEDKLPQIRLHDLRHTSASLLIASGVDPVTVSYILGHSDPSITMKVYSHAQKNVIGNAADTLGRLFG